MVVRDDSDHRVVEKLRSARASVKVDRGVVEMAGVQGSPTSHPALGSRPATGLGDERARKEV